MASKNKSQNSNGNASVDVRVQAMATRQETAQHLRNAVAITSATEELGTETLAELSRQGETIDRTQKKVDQIEGHSEQSSFMLRGMQSIFGSIKNKFSTKPKDADEFADAKAASRTGGGSSSSSSSSAKGGKPGAAPASANGAGGAGGSSSSSSSSSSTTTTTTKSTASAEEDELLEAISANVARIGNIGKAMGDELNRQDKSLDTLTASVDKVGAKVNANAKQARKIAK